MLPQNAFLIKQGSGRLQFSREKGNLLNKNSFRCSGLANAKAIHIGAPTGLVTPFAVKSGKKFQNSALKSKVRARLYCLRELYASPIAVHSARTRSARLFAFAPRFFAGRSPSLCQVASEGVKSQGKGKKGGAKAAANTVTRKNSVTHNSRHLKAIAKVCTKIGRRDLQANALARFSKVQAALVQINKPAAAQASLRGKRGLGQAPLVFRRSGTLEISNKSKRVQKKHEQVRSQPHAAPARHCCAVRLGCRLNLLHRIVFVQTARSLLSPAKISQLRSDCRQGLPVNALNWICNATPDLVGSKFFGKALRVTYTFLLQRPAAAAHLYHALLRQAQIPVSTA